MGKGDKKTKKGKRFQQSFGNCRLKNNRAISVKPNSKRPYKTESQIKINNQTPITMGILIEKVRIKNFRSLKEVEVSLTPLTLLVGSNNAGKTSFLRALNLALGVEKRHVNLDDLHRDSDGNRLQDEQGNEIKTIIIDVNIIPVNDKFEKVNEFDDDWRAEFAGDSIQLIGNQEVSMFRTQYTFSGNGSDVKVEKFIIRGNWKNPNINPQTDILTASLDKIPLYFIDAQRDIIDDLRNRTSYFGRLADQIKYGAAALSDIEKQMKKLNDDAVNNSDVMLHTRDKLKELNTALQSVNEHVEITPFPKKVRDLHKSMKIHFKDRDSDTFELDYHGMGTRSWASLLAFKAFVSWENSVKNPEPKQPYYPLLALEEPEAHLHPNAQRQLYKQLKDIQGQNIISTHSPYIAGLADLDEIRYFYKTGGEAKVASIDLSGFKPSEILSAKHEILKSKGEILFSKIVVLSEGNTEERVLPILARKYFGFDPFECGINIMGCGGNNYHLLLKIFKSLNIEWIIFSDYDKDNIKKGVNNALRGIGINDALTCPNAILLNQNLENYLITEGYQNEIKQGILKSKEPFPDLRFGKAQKTTIDAWTDDDLKKELKENKTFYATFYAEAISNITDETRRFSPKIKQLFDTIATKLNS
jgi:putative ATP-dependent endonuclease of the OLD family